MNGTLPFSALLVDRLATARRVAVLTGAGISAESGVPTFREPGGLWERFRPEELASVEGFLGNPDLVQAWYRQRRKVIEETGPNNGHLALAGLERMIDDFTVITQNVDGLHQRAGTKRVIELHGNLSRSYCISCRRYAEEADLSGPDLIRCRHCGGLIRPDVVWFGETLPPGSYERAESATRRAEVFLCVGTSSIVFPAADLPILARHAGAYVAEFNLERTPLSPHVDETIVGKAGTMLPLLLESVIHRRNETTTA